MVGMRRGAFPGALAPLFWFEIVTRVFAVPWRGIQVPLGNIIGGRSLRASHPHHRGIKKHRRKSTGTNPIKSLLCWRCGCRFLEIVQRILGIYLPTVLEDKCLVTHLVQPHVEENCAFFAGRMLDWLRAAWHQNASEEHFRSIATYREFVQLVVLTAFIHSLPVSKFVTSGCSCLGNIKQPLRWM